jgi:tRNA-splicing endonuclease subunit Sen15
MKARSWSRTNQESALAFDNSSLPTTTMDAHPSFAVLAPLLKRYPRTAGSLFQTYNDLALAQAWTDVTLLDLPACGRGALRGTRPLTSASAGADADATTHFVVPCALSEQLSADWIRAAFRELRNPEAVYLAITSEDSSLVYYKLTRGIAKPPL